jgi:hypothetical protein
MNFGADPPFLHSAPLRAAPARCWVNVNTSVGRAEVNEPSTEKLQLVTDMAAMSLLGGAKRSFGALEFLSLLTTRTKQRNLMKMKVFIAPARAVRTRKIDPRYLAMVLGTSRPSFIS